MSWHCCRQKKKSRGFYITDKKYEVSCVFGTISFPIQIVRPGNASLGGVSSRSEPAGWREAQLQHDDQPTPIAPTLTQCRSYTAPPQSCEFITTIISCCSVYDYSIKYTVRANKAMVNPVHPYHVSDLAAASAASFASIFLRAARIISSRRFCKDACRSSRLELQPLPLPVSFSASPFNLSLRL